MNKRRLLMGAALAGALALSACSLSGGTSSAPALIAPTPEDFSSAPTPTPTRQLAPLRTDLAFDEIVGCLPASHTAESIEQMAQMGVTSLGPGARRIVIDKTRDNLAIVWESDGQTMVTGTDVVYGATFIGGQGRTDLFYVVGVKFIVGHIEKVWVMAADGEVSDVPATSVQVDPDSVGVLIPSDLMPGISASTEITGELSRGGFPVSTCEPWSYDPPDVPGSQ